VVSAGQEIGRIVPTEGQLEIEVYLPNKDIGFVKEGQSVAIKLDAFPFTRYGVIEGQLVRIGRDAIPEPEARQMETEGVMRSSDGRMPGGGQRVQNLVFPMTIVPTQSFIRVDERDVPLAPGMAVSVEVKTGKRKLIDYFLSPVRADTDSAFRER
jgi:hemolysin D